MYNPTRDTGLVLRGLDLSSHGTVGGTPPAPFRILDPTCLTKRSRIRAGPSALTAGPRSFCSKLEGFPEDIQRIADVLEDAFPGMMNWGQSQDVTDDIMIKVDGYKVPAWADTINAQAVVRLQKRA